MASKKSAGRVIRRQGNPEIQVMLVAPGDNVHVPIEEDQKLFKHHILSLEYFGVSLFGDKYHKAIDRWDVGFWKKLYLDTFEVLQASIFRTTGLIDRAHRRDIEHELEHTMTLLRTSKRKDDVNAAVIAGLFKLVFLLLGRKPYVTKGRRRELNTFRTLTYSQTEDQLGCVLQAHVSRNYKEHGFMEPFEASMAYHHWARAHKRRLSDRLAVVDWVRDAFPATYALFR